MHEKRSSEKQPVEFIRRKASSFILKSLGLPSLDEIEAELCQTRQELKDARSDLRFDSLTQVGSRHAFEEDFAAFYDRCMHEKEPGQLGLMLLDVNGLKRLNDSHGHPKGDDLLRLVATNLRTHVRPGDIPYRLSGGGDEFAVLMPGFPPSPRLIETTVDRIVTSINYDIRQAAMPEDLFLGATVSIGSLLPNETKEEFFYRVDTDLTMRKQAVRSAVQEQAPHFSDSRTSIQLP